MNRKMTIFGVGPYFTLLSIGYATLILGIGLYFDPAFRISFIPYRVMATFGLVLLLIGIPMWIIGIRTVLRGFTAGQLVTTGVYSICRHPIYSAWVIFNAPGIVLFFNSWIAFSIPVMMYIFLRVLVVKEESYLESEFGQKYRAYKHRVPTVMPIGWLRTV